MELLHRPALIVVDVQRGFDDSGYWGPRDNHDCEKNIAALIKLWRDRSWPLVFVRHGSNDPKSVLATGKPGNEFKNIITGTPDLLVSKSVNSSFHGTPDLHVWLQEKQIEQVVICGITTNHCCETTARLAGNLGYDTYFAIDATHTFDRLGLDGSVIPASAVSAMTAANLNGEFATVITTQSLISENTPPEAFLYSNCSDSSSHCSSSSSFSSSSSLRDADS